MKVELRRRYRGALAAISAVLQFLATVFSGVFHREVGRGILLRWAPFDRATPPSLVMGSRHLLSIGSPENSDVDGIEAKDLQKSIHDADAECGADMGEFASFR
jgi:hypothetical protein